MPLLWLQRRLATTLLLPRRLHRLQPLPFPQAKAVRGWKASAAAVAASALK
jgi:hypothetical protein